MRIAPPRETSASFPRKPPWATRRQHGAVRHAFRPQERLIDTAEGRRLADPQAASAGGAGGPISASGNGARCARITAQTAPPGTTSRTIMRAAAPIAGARTASAAGATTQLRWCLARRAVERTRPDPQGAAVRPHQLRRQSRRGREGALLLSRWRAVARLHADALQIPAGGVPVCAGSSRRTAAAAWTSRNSSWSIPACSTSTAISTSRSNTPRRIPTTR